jgi:hypothetical protein
VDTLDQQQQRPTTTTPFLDHVEQQHTNDKFTPVPLTSRFYNNTTINIRHISQRTNLCILTISTDFPSRLICTVRKNIEFLGILLYDSDTLTLRASGES